MNVVDNARTTSTRSVALVRYGTVPEVARFAFDADLDLGRGENVVVRTHHGLLLGTLLDVLSASPNADSDVDTEVVRVASEDDRRLNGELRAAAEADFPRWIERIQDWNVDVDLVDLECTLDGEKWILYVLSDRGPGSTQLALQAAAHGLGIVDVQPVVADGPVPLEQGGCGTGGCGCSH